MSLILALDPGTTQTGWCIYSTKHKTVQAFGVSPNEEIITLIDERVYTEVACEMIASYGMAVGAEVFETCIWIGRFQQKLADTEGMPMHRVFRKDDATVGSMRRPHLRCRGC